jgi:hypothetical protein
MKWKSSLSKLSETLKKGSEKMTTADKVIKPKVGLLELGKQLGNVSKAFRLMGYSRDSFYRFKDRMRPAGKVHCRRSPGASRIYATALASRSKALW